MFYFRNKTFDNDNQKVAELWPLIIQISCLFYDEALSLEGRDFHLLRSIQVSNREFVSIES